MSKKHGSAQATGPIAIVDVSSKLDPKIYRIPKPKRRFNGTSKVVPGTGSRKKTKFS